jgi:hypothetical protein
MSLPRHSANLRGTLFPHSRLSEVQLKRVLSLFDSLNIPLPWYMEKPSFVSDAEKLGMVRVLNPPETLKPAEDFRTLLSEYKVWARLHKGSDFRAYLMASPEDGADTTWHTRALVRGVLRDALSNKENDSLGWHLLLHLAQEMEEDEQEVEGMLKSLRRKDSPLGRAVEDETWDSLFRELPELESGLMADDRRLLLVLQAWLSLFAEHLRDREPLVTLRHHVMEYVSQTWEELIEERLKVMEPAITFNVLDLSQYGMEELVQLRKKIFSNPAALRLRKSLVDFCRDPLSFSAELQKISEKGDFSSMLGINHGVMKLSLRHLAPDTRGRTGSGAWCCLGGKTMMWIGDEFSDG